MDHLAKIKKELTELSASQLATALGYRSQNTVLTWVKNRKIPATATARITAYFQRKKK